MKATVFNEPMLDFGHGGAHEDPRAGVTHYGPVDLGMPGAPTRISVGLVGPADSISGVRSWLERCQRLIEAKANNRHPRLFRGFPGFNDDCGFRSELVFDDTWTRAISNRQIGRILTKPIGLATAECVDLYHREIADLCERGVVDVVIVARPDDLQDDIPEPKRATAAKVDTST